MYVLKRKKKMLEEMKKASHKFQWIPSEKENSRFSLSIRHHCRTQNSCCIPCGVETTVKLAEYPFKKRS